MAFQFGFFLFASLFLVFLTAGIYNFMTDFEENRCNMTYMYDYPQLIRISLPKNVTMMYKKYGLYAYSEGRFIEKAREMKFNGIPVLFIPGNRGSPKQVRSLASVSLHKALMGRTSFHFDYFSLDFNEDYYGLFGGFLSDQTRFAKHCFDHIISLYRHEIPSSIILIGHSVGGIIAKGLFLEPGFDPNSVKIILTLATPHTPALLPDSMLAQYYSTVNHYWDSDPHLKDNLNLISIGGGPRDLLVRTNLTVSPHADFSVTTMGIPDVWLSVDHLCILWCKELVIVVVRSLFDCVNFKTKQINEDLHLRKEIFKYHFLDRSGSKRFHTEKYPDELALWNEGRSNSHLWIPMKDNFFFWSEKNVSQPTHITMSLATTSDSLAILTENHKAKDWIFACVFEISVTPLRVCKTGKNLSRRAKILPAAGGVKRKTALIDLSELRMGGFTHVVIRMLPCKDEVKVFLDLFKKRQRVVEENAYIFFPPHNLPKSEPASLYYTVEIPDLTKIWQTYELIVESNNCTLPALADISINIPWNHEGSRYLIKGSKGIVPIHIHSPKPTVKDPGNVRVDVILNPNCAYSFRLRRTLLPGLGAIVSKYGLSVFTYAAVCLLLTLSYQIQVMGGESKCPLLHVAMPLAAKPYIVMQASAIFSAIGQQLAYYAPFIPAVDARDSSGMMEMLVIPVFMYLAAFSLTYIIGFGVVISVVFQGQAYNSVILKFVSRIFLGFSWLSQYAMTGAIKVPLIVGAFMVTVAYTACGGLAVCIGLSFYFFKLITLYEDFWEEIVYWPLKLLKAKLKQRRDKNVEIPKFQIPPINEFSFHLTLIMLWTQVALVNVPSVLVWAKNFRYSTKLESDPGFINCFVLAVCASILWQSDFPKFGLVWSKALSNTIFVSGVLVMTFAQSSWYRLSSIITIVFALVTLHQVVAPWFTIDVKNEETVLIDETPDPPDELVSDITDAMAKDDLNIDVNKCDEGIGQEGETTPSSTTSTSSFEHILEKDVT